MGLIGSRRSDSATPLAAKHESLAKRGRFISIAVFTTLSGS
jgi:hypothetical protein